MLVLWLEDHSVGDNSQAIWGVDSMKLRFWMLSFELFIWLVVFLIFAALLLLLLRALYKSARGFVRLRKRKLQLKKREYAFDELVHATKNFLDGLDVEKTMFHGEMFGTSVVVKRVPSQLLDDVRDLDRQYCDVSHPNLASVLGICEAQPHACLLYLLSRGDSSLEERLALHGGLSPLSAAQRAIILSDVSRGLCFLHERMSLPHGGVRSANIFLDPAGQLGVHARLGEYCTMSMCRAEQSRVYMPAQQLAVGNEADMFAFGLVVSEAVTGYSTKSKRTYDAARNAIHVDLHALVTGELKLAVDRTDEATLQHWTDEKAGSWDQPIVGLAKRLLLAAVSCLDVNGQSRLRAADAQENLDRLRESIEQQYRRDRAAIQAAITKDGFALISLDANQPTWHTLEGLLHTDPVKLQQAGKDRRTGARHDRLKLVCAWRLDHPSLWQKYMGGVQQVPGSSLSSSFTAGHCWPKRSAADHSPWLQRTRVRCWPLPFATYHSCSSLACCSSLPLAARHHHLAEARPGAISSR